MAILSDLLVGLLIWLALVVLGRQLLALADFRWTSNLDQAVFAAALGSGAMAYLMFALGLIDGYRPWLAWGTLVVILGLFWRHVVKCLQDFGYLLERLIGALRADPLGKGLGFGLLIAAATIRLGGALAPPTGVDSLVYHLPLPQAYIRAGGIVFVPNVLPYGEFPQNVEMLFVFGMLLRSAVVAQVVHWGFGILLAMALYVLARSELDPLPAMLAAAIFYAGGDVAAESGWALVDLAVAAYQALAIIALVRFLEYKEPPWLILAGLLAGFAAGSRYTGAAVTVVMCGLLVWEGVRGRLAAQEVVCYSAVCSILTAFLLAPWLMKNWILAGNPVSPLATSLFPNQPYAEAIGAWMSSFRTYKHFPLPKPGILAVPIWLTFSPGTLLGSYTGPIYLAALPSMLIFPQSLRCRRVLLAVVLLLPLWYFGYLPQTRYFLAAIGLLTVPALTTLQRLAASRKLVSTMVTGGIWGWCIMGLLGLSLYYHAGALPYVLGRQTREQYLVYRLPGRFSRFTWYSEVLWINDNTPKDSLILVQDTRWPYMERDVVHLADWVQTWGDPDICARDALECLCRAGITHAVLFPADPDTFPLRRSLEQLVNNHQLGLLRSGKTASVYEVECARSSTAPH